MGGEVGGSLKVQAALRGAVDFSRARLNDPRWHKHLSLILVGIEEENYREQVRLQLDFNLALIANNRLTDESWGKSRDSAIDLLHEFNGSLSPDQRKSKTEMAKESASRMADSWAREFGDQDDPEIIAKIDAVAEGLLQQAKARR